jgi:uncharacterized protein YjbI with pentapeptide repeats
LRDLSGVDFTGNILKEINFASQNLTGARFENAILGGADFTDANIQGSSFTGTTKRGFTSQQFYSTASYQTGDLVHVRLVGNDLTNWNFAGKHLEYAAFGEAGAVDAYDQPRAILRGANFENASLRFARLVYCELRDANFKQADLRNAWVENANVYQTDFSRADLRGARGFNPDGAILQNSIRPDGRILGLNLGASERLLIRNYTVDESEVYTWEVQLPILIARHARFEPTGTLQVLLDGDPWGSTISFSPSIPVSLDGTLQLLFAEKTDVQSLLGNTFRLFDWGGVTPTGRFAVESPYTWDLSQLYQSGNVKLLTVPEPQAWPLMLLGLLEICRYRSRAGRHFRAWMRMPLSSGLREARYSWPS